MDSSTMHFDDLLVKIGEFGRFQKLLISAMVVFMIGNTWQYYFTNFIAGKMAHWCKIPEIPHGLNATWIKEIMIPRTVNELGYEEFSQCEMYNYSLTDITLINDTHIWTMNVTTVPCQYGWEYDHTEFHSTIVSQFDLVCDKDWMFTLPATAFIIGSFVGSFICGYISDRFGRKWTVVLMIMVQLISITAAAFSPYFWMFFAFRCLVGASSMGSFSTFWILVLEAMPPIHRAHCSYLIAVGKIVGCLLPVVAYFVRNHIHLQLISVGFAVPGLICILLVPESPRWLLSQKRYNDFHVIVKKIASINKSSLPDNELVITPMVKTNEIKQEGTTEVEQKKLSLLALLRTPQLRKRTFILWLVWFAGTFAANSILLNIGTLIPGNIYLNTILVLGISDLASFVTIYFALFKFNRRPTLMFFFLLNGLCSLIMIPFLKIDIPILVTILALIGSLALKSLSNVNNLYTGEVFPTPIRNIGFGSASSVGRIGGLISPQLPLLKAVWFGLPYICLAIFPIAAGIFAFFLPETKGKHLPETFEDAEKFGTRKYNNDRTDPEMDDNV